MKNLLSIDHIGYAVRDIMTTAQHYLDAGWTMSEIYEEKVQNTKIAFLYKDGFTTIELVSPLNESPSPVDKFLAQGGVQPYHICYAVEDIWATLEDLHNEGILPLFMPVPSVAMNNRQICYLYNNQIGLIEIVTKE